MNGEKSKETNDVRVSDETNRFVEAIWREAYAQVLPCGRVGLPLIVALETAPRAGRREA